MLDQPKRSSLEAILRDLREVRERFHALDLLEGIEDSNTRACRLRSQFRVLREVAAFGPIQRARVRRREIAGPVGPAIFASAA